MRSQPPCQNVTPRMVGEEREAAAMELSEMGMAVDLLVVGVAGSLARSPPP